MSHSKTEAVASTTVWIAITQFANMALIPILCAQTGEVDGSWYQKVGINILTNFALYSFTPNISGVISPFITLFISRTTGDLTAINQDDLNLMYAGPDLYEYI